jgi:hypothetical protein
MFPHHYSKTKYPELKTLELQGNLTEEERQAAIETQKFRQEPSLEGFFDRSAPADPTVVDQYLTTVNPNVKKNVTVVSPEDLGTDTLFHITGDPKIRSFNPRVSQKTMHTEDRSLPRVSTSPYIGGALAGYAIVEFEFNLERSRKDFRGGWYIYAIPFEYALKPNKEVQPDVEGTDEIWLVPYNEKQWKIIPKRIGEFFIDELRVRWEGKRRIIKAIFCLNNDSNQPIALSRDATVGQGYWTFSTEGFNNDFHTTRKYLPPVITDLRAITASEYALKKKLSASLLSYITEESKPMFIEDDNVETLPLFEDETETSMAFENFDKALIIKERLENGETISKNDFIGLEHYLPESISLESFINEDGELKVSNEGIGLIAAIAAIIVAIIASIIAFITGRKISLVAN